MVIRTVLTPPALESAEIDGATLMLTFDKPLDATSGTAASQFTIAVGGGAAQAATTIAIAGKQVMLTVPAVAPGQAVTVSYANTGSNPLKGANQLEVAAFSGEAVTNNTGVVALVGNDMEADAANTPDFNKDRAQGFTTGGDSDGYKLTSVQIEVATGGSLTGYGVKIMSDGSPGPGSTEVGTLNTLPSLSAGIGNSFTGDVDLAANTTYYVVLDLTASNGTVTLKSTSSGNENPGGAPGWSLWGNSHSRDVNDSTAWIAVIEPLKIVVNGYSKQVPTMTGVEIDGDTLELTFDRDLDAASVPAAGRFAIKAGGGPAQPAPAIVIAGWPVANRRARSRGPSRNTASWRSI